MNQRRFSLFTMVALCLQTNATAFVGGPVLRDVPLLPNRSIILHPHEHITLKYEIRDGKIVILRTIPTAYPMEEDTVTLSLYRTGGKITRFGTVTPFHDWLTISGKPDIKIGLRCRYLTEGLRDPVTRSIPSSGHGFGKKIAWIEILDFRLLKP